MNRLILFGILLTGLAVSEKTFGADGKGLRAFDAGKPVHQKAGKSAGSGFSMSKISINKGYPCELAEIVFYNGEKRVRTDRSSPFTAGLAQPDFCPLFDGDVATLAVWPKGRPLFGHAPVVSSPLPYLVTHMLIATPNASRLKGQLTLSHGSSVFTFDLGTLAKAGAGSVYKILIHSGDISILDSLPAAIQPYADKPLSDSISGTVLDFEKANDLVSCNLSTEGKAQWVCKNGFATIELATNATDASGRMVLPDSLNPGQSVGIRVDHGYAMWQGRYRVNITLGSSSFSLDHEGLMTVPKGDRYIAESFGGSGLRNYSLLLVRGSGKRSNIISWAVIGNGFNRRGTAALHDAEGHAAALPIAVEIGRQWGWRWFNHRDMTDWTIRLDEVKLDEVRVGTFTGSPTGLSEARRFTMPSKDVPDRHWYSKLEKSGASIPEWTLSPEAGKTITADELNRICSLFPNVPLPKSNLICNIYWSQVGAASRFYKLLQATGDERVLNQLLVWSEEILAYRNGGDFSQVPLLVPGSEKGEMLPGWSDLQFAVCVDGEMNYASDIWDYACWVPFAYYTEYVSRHPELWDQLVAVGAFKGEKTHFEMMKLFADEIFRSVEVVQEWFTEDDGLTIPRPWNRYATLIEGFHYLRLTYDNLAANGVEINGARRELAEGFVEAFLSDFFDPAHFKIYPIERQGKVLDAATFCYAKNTGSGEDIQHGTAECALLMLLHESGLYRELLSPAQYGALCNTVKYVIIRGFDEKGNVQYGATFTDPPSDKHGGVTHFPESYINQCRDDEELYNRLLQQFHAGEPKTWKAFVEAVLRRVE